jgi:DNA repair protein RadC
MKKGIDVKTFLPAYSLKVVKENHRCSEPYPEVFRSSDQVARLARECLEPDDREHFWVLLLDTRNHIKGVHHISTGSLTSSLVHPRESYRLAVQLAASAVIFFHNHPSGDSSPSREDADLTRRLFEGGKILGIRVLDHVIVGDHNSNRHFSFADSGDFPPA